MTPFPLPGGLGGGFFVDVVSSSPIRPGMIMPVGAMTMVSLELPVTLFGASDEVESLRWMLRMSLKRSLLVDVVLAGVVPGVVRLPN